MADTSMIPSSGTHVTAEGATQKLTIQAGQTPVSSGHIPAEFGNFPVRVRSSEARVLIRVDADLMRQQQETEDANEAIRRRLRG